MPLVGLISQRVYNTCLDTFLDARQECFYHEKETWNMRTSGVQVLTTRKFYERKEPIQE